MPIAFACGHCGKSFNVDDGLAGRRVKCKACGRPLTVPASSRRPAAVDALSALAEEDDEAPPVPRARPMPRAGGRGPSGPAQGGGSGVPAWVWLAGGAVGLVLLMLITAAVLFRPGSRAAGPPTATAGGDTTEDGAKFQADETSAAATPSAWRLKADPDPNPAVYPEGETFSVVVPESYSGGLVYPSTPSPFVIIGGNDVEKHYRQVIDLRNGQEIGRLAGHIDAGKPMALSPDGEYFAVRNNNQPRTTDVWRISDATRVARIEDGKDLPDYLDFGGPGQLVIGITYGKKLRVWDFLKGKVLSEITLPASFKQEAVAFSPGRRYMVVTAEQQNKLHAYDLTNGRRAGEIELPKDGNAGYDCRGLAFSPDGTLLAGQFGAAGKTHVVCWNAQTGKLVSDTSLPGDNPFGKSFAYKGRTVQWLPDQSGWLMNDQTFVERETGQVVWTEAFPPIKYKVHGTRTVVDLGRMFALAEENGQQVLKLVPLPKAKIAAAMAIAKGGGNSVDAVLPTLTETDLRGAKSVAPEPGPVSWSGPPGPAPATTPAAPATASKKGGAASKGAAGSAKPIAVNVPAGDVLYVTVSSPEASQALVVSSPGGRLTDVKSKQSQQPRTVGRFDLAAGRPLETFELPSVAVPAAFGPGASRFLVTYPSSPDRLDVHEAAGGAHAAGWRPYGKESGDARDVVWADFLDSGRVLTASKAGTLALWTVPECKAVYVAPKAVEGVPALSPNRKALATLHNGALRLIDPATGKVLGDGSGTGRKSAAGLAAAGFSPDGKELAAVVEGSIVRWDLTNGQVLGESASPATKNVSLQYGDAHHVLIDGRVLVDLEADRPVCFFEGGVFAQGGHGAGARYVASEKLIGPGFLRALEIPDTKSARAEAALADPKTPALLRDGSKISIQIVGEPGRDPAGFRRELTEGLTAGLQKAGVEVADNQPVKLVVRFEVKDTGRKIEYRKFGGTPGANEKRVIDEKSLEWELSVADDKGPPVVIARDKVGFTSTGFLDNIPNGESDWEGFLRARQYANGSKAVVKYGVPYYVARRPDGAVFLPGRVSLGFPTF